MKKKWFRQKTTWAALTTIVGSAAGFFTGTIDMGTALQAVSTAVIGMFLRQGVENIKN